MTNDGCRCVVLGIGNPDRGDDAAGRIVAQRLRGLLPVDIEIIEHDGEGTSLLGQLCTFNANAEAFRKESERHGH